MIAVAPRYAEREGWHSRGYLPHFDAQQLVQSVTFRLADSMPAHLLRWADSDLVRRKQIDAMLDSGLGSCALREIRIASLIEAALLHFDGQRYHLLAWCIMPNHVHVIVELLGDNSLSAIIQSWKSFTAKRANPILGQAGKFWAPDYFDRYIRDATHLAVAIAYIENNPVKAGLARSPDDWTWSSAGRRVACGRVE
ncbi:MAG TPA: transposase [Vineibacter sp.]|nr:transposase [Vineibacter sp.]